MEDIQSNEQELSTEVSSEDPNAAPDGSNQEPGIEIDGQRYTAAQIKQMRDAEKRFTAAYTQKTQTFAQERQQFNRSAQALRDGGLEADLQRIRNGQASVADFKRVYHKDFHHYADQLLNQTKNQPNQNGQAGFDPAFLERFNQVEQRFQQMQIEAIDKELDLKEQEYSKKYPYADPAAVYMQAESLIDYKNQNGHKAELTSKEWDNIWKNAHDKQSERFKQYQSSLTNGQKRQNAKSRDIGAGGGIPGQAPRTAKNLKEAEAMALQHLDEF